MKTRLAAALFLTTIAVASFGTASNVALPTSVRATHGAPARTLALAAVHPGAARTTATTHGAPASKSTPIGGTTLGSPAPTTGYCATWKRRWYNAATKKWVYTDHNTPAANGSDQHLGTPENIIVKSGDQGHNDARYAVVADDVWVEALGGGGYGSNGYPYPWLGPPNANGNPKPNATGAGETGEGGVVQGEVHPQGQSVNFSVWSFSLDDEGDNTVFHDTINGACVQAAGTTVSSGDVSLPTHGIVPHP